MAINAAATSAIDVEDVEYIRHGDKPLLARVFKPRGTGPFPLIVELHGGAWCRGDRLQDTALNETLAKSGMVVAALDFRMPPADAGYPASMADINYAIRFFKTRATEMGSRPDMVGALGISSGAHQAMLNAMRPKDPRSAALPLPAGAAAVDANPDVVDSVLPLHDLYWKTEAAMAEGNPVLALERGEQMEMPPVLYLQGSKDVAHPRPDLDRFVAGYRKAGGQVELEIYEGEGQAFITRNPGSPAAAQATEKIIEFVHKQIR